MRREKKAGLIVPCRVRFTAHRSFSPTQLVQRTKRSSRRWCGIEVVTGSSMIQPELAARKIRQGGCCVNGRLMRAADNSQSLFGHSSKQCRRSSKITILTPRLLWIKRILEPKVIGKICPYCGKPGSVIYETKERIVLARPSTSVQQS